VVSFGVAMGIVVGGLLLCVVTVLTKRYRLCSVYTNVHTVMTNFRLANYTSLSSVKYECMNN